MSRRVQLLFLVFCISGCDGFKTGLKGQTVDPQFLRQGEGTLQPSTDKIDPGCQNSADFDACIWWKNPVAQAGASVTVEQLQGTRMFGIKLRGLFATGNLGNSRVSVLTLASPRLSLFAPEKLKKPIDENESYAEQVSAYYWANLALDYLDKRVGSRAEIHAVKIYVDDIATGISIANNSIHLQKRDKIPKALSGELVVHLLGQILAAQLSGQKIIPHSTAQHKYCSLDSKGCCVNAQGCSNALLNAFGEYVAAMIFPTSPRIGESVSLLIAGQQLCGLPRDPNILKDKSKSEVFNACAPSGYAPLMGSWYAAIWWRLREQAETQEAGSAQHIDRLFFDHAQLWTGSFTFTEAKAAALQRATTYENGKFKSLMEAAFQSADL